MAVAADRLPGGPDSPLLSLAATWLCILHPQRLDSEHRRSTSCNSGQDHLPAYQMRLVARPSWSTDRGDTDDYLDNTRYYPNTYGTNGGWRCLSKLELRPLSLPSLFRIPLCFSRSWASICGRPVLSFIRTLFCNLSSLCAFARTLTMLRLLALALILTSLEFSVTSAGPACAARHKNQEDCMSMCASRWGWPGSAMGTDPWGAVMTPMATVSTVTVVQTACGVQST